MEDWFELRGLPARVGCFLPDDEIRPIQNFAGNSRITHTGLDEFRPGQDTHARYDAALFKGCELLHINAVSNE